MSAICTIELNARDLKLLEAKRGRPIRHAEASLPDGAYSEGMPTRTFVDFLKSTLRSTNVAARQARLAIADSGITVRDLQLPSMTPDELRAAVTFEAKRLIPMDPGDVYYAWHVRRVSRGYAVYLVAARREMVDGLVAAIAGAGLRVERIDLKAFGLARGAEVSDGLILDWGLGEATLVLQAGGRPIFFRSLLLDTPEGDTSAQFEELQLSVNALVKFIRSAQPDAALGQGTPLFLSGRFATLAGAEAMARERLPFAVQWPAPKPRWPRGFPWQAHLTGLGLLRPSRWQDRITAAGGAARAAA